MSIEAEADSVESRVDFGPEVAAALDVLDAFTAAFNACDLAAMDQQLHFPHLVMAGSQLLTWPVPGQMPKDFFDELTRTGWRRTTYVARLPILAAINKVHFLVSYTRDSEHGTPVSSHDNVWIVTQEDDRWGIKLRSY